MDGGGGFLVETGSLSYRTGAAGSVHGRRAEDRGDARQEETAAKEVRKLSQKQEIRLMNYLDDAFLQLNRNFSKRYTAPESTNVATLELYVAAVERIMAIIASIPPVGSSAPLLVTYLLRVTSELCDGIQGYDLGHHAAEADEAGPSTANGQLQHAVRTLRMLDRIWAATLRGHLVDMKGIRQNVEEEGKEETSHSHLMSSKDTEDRTGRYADENRSQKAAESHQVLGSRGFATVGQTHRIRLRNVIILAKENLFAWMRTQLDVPLPPLVEGSSRDAQEERRELVGVEGDVDQVEEMVQAGELEALEEDEGIPLEEVQTGDHDGKGTTKHDAGSITEQEHYSDLFARPIDPDASDGDEYVDKDRVAGSVTPIKRERLGSSPLDDNVAHKRRRNDDDDDASLDDTTIPPRTEAESRTGFNGVPITYTVMQWDVAFARLFARTLRCLSDVQEYAGQRIERERAQAGDDAGVFASEGAVSDA